MTYINVMVNLKKCSDCKLEKSFKLFGNSKTSKDGLYFICKICVSKNNKELREKTKKEILLNRFVEIKEKKCTQCKELKFVEQFYKRNASKDGYDIYCKVCEKTNVKNRIEQRQSELVISPINSKTEKLCISCNVEKNNINFYKNKRNLDGLSVYCKTCKRNKRLLKKYKMEIGTFDKMYEERNGCCDICEKHIEKRKICVDHEHSTGKVRGLLCRVCNTSLGAMKENINLLQNMIDYIILWNT